MGFAWVPKYTVPFRLIQPVTCHRVCDLVLILVNVTHHIDFGHMWEMVQKKNSFKINKNIFLSLFKNLFSSTLDTTIISKMSNTHWHPGKRCCIPLHEKNLSKFWLKILFVTSHNTSGPNVEMRLLCHMSHPRLNWLKWYSRPISIPMGYHVPTILQYLCGTWTSTPKLGLQCLQGGKHLHCWSGDIIITLYRSVPESRGWLVQQNLAR